MKTMDTNEGTTFVYASSYFQTKTFITHIFDFSHWPFIYLFRAQAFIKYFSYSKIYTLTPVLSI